VPEFNYYDRQILDVKTNLDKVNMDDNNQNTLTQNQIQILKSAFLDLFHGSVNEIMIQNKPQLQSSVSTSLQFRMRLTRTNVMLQLNPNSNQKIQFLYHLNVGNLLVDSKPAGVKKINKFVNIVGNVMELIEAKKTVNQFN
tara:strand:- start:377 stop:799 length:423 start_codon:yes stop_codon:yes gene_type:complete